MIENFQFKEHYDINDLIDIVEILRSPEGCPWDREQDHKSIRRDFLEETYEVIEAINKDDKDMLLEEQEAILCAILSAVAQKSVPKSRHTSYLELYDALKDKKEWMKD